jgi:hypothetical protein
VKTQTQATLQHHSTTASVQPWERLNILVKELLNDADPNYVVEKFGNDPEGISLLNAISGRFEVF